VYSRGDWVWFDVAHSLYEAGHPKHNLIPYLTFPTG
jgi:hypothetical protein